MGLYIKGHEMSKQHYVRVEPGTPRKKGDVFCCYQTSKLRPVKHFIGKTVQANDFILRPVDPEPVNPWIKGSDRLPTEEDSSNAGLVDSWDEHTQSPIPILWNAVQPSYCWRPIDQTPPPAGPTEAELVEELLTTLANEDCGFRARELAKKILAKRESEGRNE